MILVDSRVGSAEFAKLLPKDICEVTFLEYADFMIEGKGYDGAAHLVGIERKTLSDFVQSINSGRLINHQLPGLLNNYNTVYIILEGMFKYDLKSGNVMHRVGKSWIPVQYGKTTYKVNRIVGVLNTLSVTKNVIVIRTTGKTETARYLISLHHWWTSKNLEEHTSAEVKDIQPIQLTRQPMTYRIALQLPGIGAKKAMEIAKHFKTPLALVTASAYEYMQIPVIGKGIAKRIVEELNNE